MVVASAVAAMAAVAAAMGMSSMEMAPGVVIGPVVGLIIGFVIIPVVVVDPHIGSGAAGEQGEEERRPAEQSHSFHGSSLVHIPQSARGAAG